MTDTKPAPPDWERIEVAYRAGVLSLREIAALNPGVNHVAITRRAKKQGWIRPASTPVGALSWRSAPGEPAACHDAFMASATPAGTWSRAARAQALPAAAAIVAMVDQLMMVRRRNSELGRRACCLRLVPVSATRLQLQERIRSLVSCRDPTSSLIAL